MEKRGQIPNKLVLTILAVSLWIILLIVLFHKPISNFTGKIIDELQALQPEAVPGTINVTTDFTKEIGVVRSDFYGVNTHGSWLGSGTTVDANADGTTETASDLAWHRQMFLDSGMKLIRWDASLGAYYVVGWINLDFETWVNTNKGPFNADSESGAVGWKVSTYGGGTGLASQSTDALSGSYSLNITGIQNDHVFIYKDAQLTQGNLYNYSVWVKANGTFSISIQRLEDYTYCNSNTFNNNEVQWQLISVSCTPTSATARDYRLLKDSINAGETILVDDTNLTENGIAYNPNYVFTGDLSNRISQLQWAHNNG